jgi:hypothetical protein
MNQQFSGRPQPSSSTTQTPQKVHLVQKIKPPSRGSCCPLSALPVLLRYSKLCHQPERGGANSSMEVRNQFSTSSRAHVSFSSSISQSLRPRAVTVGIEVLPHSTDLIGYRVSQWEHSIPGQERQIEPLLQTPFPEKCMDDGPLLCIGERDLWYQHSQDQSGGRGASQCCPTLSHYIRSTSAHEHHVCCCLSTKCGIYRLISIS